MEPSILPSCVFCYLNGSMLDLSEEKSEGCQTFLTSLIKDEDLETCPFTALSGSWKKHELEGEVIDVLLRFLRQK